MSRGVKEHWKSTHVGGTSMQKTGGPVHEGCATCGGDGGMESSPSSDTSGASEKAGSPKGLTGEMGTKRGGSPI